MATARLDGSTSVAVSTVGSSSRRLGRRGAQGLVIPVVRLLTRDHGYLAHSAVIGVVAIALRCELFVCACVQNNPKLGVL